MALKSPVCFVQRKIVAKQTCCYGHELYAEQYEQNTIAFFFISVYLFTGAMHTNKHNCKRARISPKGYFSSVDPWQNVKRSP